MGELEKHDTKHPRQIEATLKSVLDPMAVSQYMRVTAYAPSAGLAPFVECYWVARWTVGPRTHQLQRILSHPSAQITFRLGQSVLQGVDRGVATTFKTGSGRAFGVRFRAGGLHPYLRSPVKVLTDQTVSPDAVISLPVTRAERDILNADSDSDMVEAADSILEPRAPEKVDPIIAEIDSMLLPARRGGGLHRVEAMAKSAGCSVRTLQRLFLDYVGVSPKWVVSRYRLQEAAWRLARRSEESLAALAAELGYYDQAHFNADFLAHVGVSPAAYRAAQWRCGLPSLGSLRRDRP